MNHLGPGPLNRLIDCRMDKQHKARWLALFILGLGMFVGVVDSSVVSVATPAMQVEFNASEPQMLMVVTIYSLVFASFLLLFGKVGHRFGLRRLQALGAGLFGLSSFLIGLAPSIGFTNGMRAFAGLAAAMGGATGLALVHSIFKGADRALAFGIWGAAAKSAIGRVGNSFGAAFVGILIVISINDVLIMALIFIVIALALAFTLPNVKSKGGGRVYKGR